MAFSAGAALFTSQFLQSIRNKAGLVERAPHVALLAYLDRLPEQREDALLSRVRLCQRRNAGLVQDGEP